jgi:signal transduction histidine kinase
MKLDSKRDRETMEELLVALNVVALERLEIGIFRLLGSSPSWFTDIYSNVLSEPEKISLAGLSPFLDNFLIDAEDFWNNFSSGHLKSGLWIEASPAGKEYHLEAVAIFLEKDQKKVLLIEFSRISYEEKHHLIQTGRDISLKYYQLSKEIQKKEILLHCIIHDLNSPLTGIKGSFSLLSLEELSPEQKDLVDLGLAQSERQENLIKEILDIFAAEVDSLKKFYCEPSKAPNVMSCIRQVSESLVPAFLLKQVKIELAEDIDLTENWLVVGEVSRLERVISNLLENALRYSPKGGTVTIGLKIEDNFVVVSIEDQGKGVPEGATANLFQKFYQVGSFRGKAGLGLYFCRMMVEQWGGSIGYSNSDKGGARFWFRLPRPFATEQIQ